MSKRPPKKQAGLTYDQLARNIKQGEIDPMYLFVGEEDYLHRQALELLFASVDESARQFNIAVFTVGGDLIGPGSGSSKASVSIAIDNANMLPMLAGRRIVVIREFDKIKESELDSVFEYLKRPSASSTVVFQGRSLDQRRKISAALLKTCTVVSFEHPSEEQAARWAESYLRKKGCSIERHALGDLIGLTGCSMSRLANEMDKLATYSGGGQIGLETVKSLVPRAREHTSFELWAPIMERKRERALKIIRRLMDDGAEAIAVVGALGSLYRKMLIAKDLIARGAPAGEVAAATGQYGYRAGEFNARVARISREEIVHGIKRIAWTDDNIKNSVGRPELLVEFLVAELTIPESARWHTEF